MEQFTTQGEVTRDGVLRIEVPCHLPPGPVEVSMTIRLAQTQTLQPDWRELYGLGKEIWQGIEPLEYLQELRRDRESLP